MNGCLKIQGPKKKEKKKDVEVIQLNNREFQAVLDVYNLLEKLSVVVKKPELREVISDGHESLKRILEKAKEAELN